MRKEKICRPARDLTWDEGQLDMLGVIRPIVPEPPGTYIVTVHKIVGYISDCNGTQFAELMQVDRDGNDIQLQYNGVKLDSRVHLVVDHPTDLWIP